jgi:GNAT superfamily N-acetyltransferase
VPGSDYQVRSAGPQDADLIREFVCGLSVRTQYFRFFTAASPPSSGLLRALTGDDSGRSDILVITDECGAVIGHGMAVDAHRDGVLCADIGLVIADSRQGQGLGTTLLSMLADRAARRGVAALVLDVLPDNARMLGIIDRRWPGASRTRTLDAIVITAAIPARRQASPARDWVAMPARPVDQGALHGSGRSAA